ncbi:phage tail protein [Cohnella xylanilytica]|uniref:Phage tail protein n=1 Tax=Cohnella xylanilytica TaxID=557555 RepID=A0A841TVK7_9BACL|nr:phage tail spike protein [Cohnella xylanilytica]MBB6689900.1 phage tail protein [Cohnella xylanilytica]
MSRSRLELWDTVERLAYLPAAFSVRIREVLSGEYFVTFQYPKLAGDGRYDLLITGNEIRFPKDIEYGQHFVIKRVEEVREGGKISKTIEAHHVALQLGQYFFDLYIDFRAAQTPEAMLSMLLVGTPYTYVVSGSFGARDISEWGEKSRLALLYELCDVFGAELSFNNYEITFAIRKGADNGKQVRYRKNMKGIRRTETDLERITRLYGYGKDGLTIEGYAGHTRKYIDSIFYDRYRPFEASKEWPEIEDQGKLLSTMESYLSQYEVPQLTYETETVNLGPVEVGDTITVLDAVLGYDVSARLQEYERYPFQPEQRPRLVIANFRERNRDDYLIEMRRRQKETADALARRAAQIEKEQTELEQAQDDYQQYVEGAFQDGVISAAEAKAIAEHKRTLGQEKSDVDSEYTNVMGNGYLTDAAVRASLQNAKTAYDSAFSALNTAIDNAIADGKTTPAESTAVKTAFATLATRLATLRAAFQAAMQSITQKAEGNAKSYADELNARVQTQLSELSQAQNDFETYLDGAFSDGLISTAESKAIAEHKLSLAKEKADVDIEYQTIYNNLYLTNTTLKGALGTAKTNYDKAYAALIAAIDTVIADKRVTPAERANVDAKFADLTNKLATLRQAMQDCVKSIGQAGLDAVAGFGIALGCIISIENRSQVKMLTTLTSSAASGATTLNVGNGTVDAWPSSGTAYIWSASFGEPRAISYSGKTATSLTGITGITSSYSSGTSVYLWNLPTGDIVVSAGTAIMPDGRYLQIPAARFNGQTLGTNPGDYDGWEFRHLWIDVNGNVQLAAAGTSGGWNLYPPNPPAGSLRIGYMLVGYGMEDPDGSLNSTKDYATDKYPNFKERIYHDYRYRDQRAITAVDNDVAYGGVPNGAQTLSVSVSGKQYQTYYIPIGMGKRSVKLAISLDDGSGYDAYTYGADLTIGRKAANNADGKGRSVWGTYVDSSGSSGMVNGQRNASPYGVHILTPRVWGKTYTMLYDADLMPDPADASRIALKLTFYNYSASTTESFDLSLRWHAL